MSVRKDLSVYEALKGQDLRGWLVIEHSLDGCQSIGTAYYGYMNGMRSLGFSWLDELTVSDRTVLLEADGWLARVVDKGPMLVVILTKNPSVDLPTVDKQPADRPKGNEYMFIRRT